MCFCVSKLCIIFVCFANAGVDERNETKGYSEEFQAMLDRLEQEDSYEDASLMLEKKRRLGFDQVKALEKSFELDNKLEPERKVKLAEELGLQPRQVSIWFQNRRARLKTKQLERDYGVLKSNFDVLKVEYSNLQQENEALTTKVLRMQRKFVEKQSMLVTIYNLLCSFKRFNYNFGTKFM